MKKNTLYIIIAVALLVAAIVAVLFKTGVIGSSDDHLSYGAFAIKDTNTVTKIFLADMQGEYVLLQRTDAGWVVRDSILVMNSIMEEFLTTIASLSVKQVVPKTGQNTINKVLSTGSVKVDIYQQKPKFKIFGIPFGNKERKTKTYYMGPATMDNMANFALLEGADDPYIVYLPGFRGFASPIYSTNYADWINHDIFQTKITRIQTAEFIDLEHPEESFKAVKTGARFFDLYDYQNQKINTYDTLKLIDMLSEFRDKNFEDIILSFSSEKIDSIYREQHFKTIIITDLEGNKTTLELCHKWDQLVDEDDNPVTEADEDRFFGIINHNYQQMVLCQFFHFDRQIQPLSYFTHTELQK
ncbi:MAG: hypothetical protein J5644_04345 [Bacteroidales bacterium]|nr:hypothetical protein [Bacteroidales bacterium]